MSDSLATIFDADAIAALREILADPSVPVSTTLTGTSESDGRRIAALREAHDYLTSRRLASGVQSVDAATALRVELTRIDPALTTVRWHSVVLPVLAALEPSRARNAILGDVHRGDLLTWATTVRRLAWLDDARPTADQPVARVDAEFEVDEFPGLYDSIVVWDSVTKSLVIVPTHRERVSWTASAEQGGWVVHLQSVVVHRDELIALDADPRHRAEWVNPHSDASAEANGPTGVRPPALDSSELQRAIDEIARDASARRAAGGQPRRAVELAKEHRLGAVRVPVELGGGGYSKREFFELVIRLAEADPDVPHILRVHWGFVEDRLRLHEAEHDTPWLAQIVDGVLFGGASSELTDRPPGVYTFDTTLTPDGAGYRLNGRKFYSTGSQYSDVLRITANDPDGRQRSVLIPADRVGVVHADDWDGIGQRETGSGTTILDQVYVAASELVPFERYGANGRPRGSQPQLILHAIAAGILRSVASEAAELVRTRRRSYSWAVTEEPRHDPQLLQIIGSLTSAAFVAEAAVLAAADAQDRAARYAHAHGRADVDLEHEASLQASKAKVGIEEFALRAAGDLFAVGGASATRASAHLDRHWRNLRTLFSHNPTPYKARAVGDHLVNGNPLPTVGFF